MTNTVTFVQRKDTKNVVKSSTEHLTNLEAFILNLIDSDDFNTTTKLINDLVFYIEKDLPIFNSNYREIIKDVCDTFNAPTGFYIPSVLSTVSTAIGKNVTIQDNRGVKEKASLYVCIVSNSGTGKTPSIDWCIKPIKKLEAENWKAYKQEQLEAEQNETDFTKKHNTSYLTDATIEALTTNLNNSKGILYFRDELIGWLKDMNKYRSSGSDDLLFMQMWNSNDAIRAERQTKSIYIENPFLNVLGGTQPKRLGEFTKKFATDSGFFQRILFSYPTATIQDRTNKKENRELKELYSNLITKIYNDCRSFEQEITLELSEKSNNNITLFVNHFIKKQQRLYKSNSLIIEILSKLETYLLRFALIFEIMDSDEINWTGVVSDNSIIKSISMVLYFYSYAHKVVNTNNQNSIYTNDSDRIIHNILSNKFSQGEVFTTAQAVNLIGNKFSRQIVSKHLRDTGKYLYENLSRGKYSLL